MKRIHNKILAMLLVLALTFSCMPENVYAASHLTTEEADGEMEETVNAEVYFVHAATGKIITMSGTLDQQVDCTNVYDSNNVPENAKMTIYYGVGNWGESDGKEVVNFVNKQNGKSWRVDDDVTQINAYTNPTGWESVRMEPQGDGTIAFISCANARYVSVIDEKLGTTTDTTFVDENPNASKYQNYYKIKGANDADVSELS